MRLDNIKSLNLAFTSVFDWGRLVNPGEIVVDNDYVGIGIDTGVRTAVVAVRCSLTDFIIMGYDKSLPVLFVHNAWVRAEWSYMDPNGVQRGGTQNARVVYSGNSARPLLWCSSDTTLLISTIDSLELVTRNITGVQTWNSIL